MRRPALSDVRSAMPLLAIFVAGAAFIAYWTLQVEEWGLMTDELLYVKLAQSFGDTLSVVPTVRGEYYGQFTPVYPLLIAPLLQVMDTTAAFKVAHGLNAVLMASTAIPTYLLARDISRSRAVAYGAAATAVVVPWVVYANMLLTESAAYPVFMWTVLAMTSAVVRPSPRRDAIAVGAIVLAVLTRTQFALLGGVLVLSVVIHELTFESAWLRERGRLGVLRDRMGKVLREHAVLAVATAIGAALLVLLAATGGVQRGAGAYGNTLTGDLLPHGISRSFRAHLAMIAANVAVLPLVLAIAWGVTTIVRPRERSEHAFAVLLGLIVIGVVLQAASVNLRTIGLVQERYAFYIAPLLVIAAGTYALRPRMRWLGLAAGALVTVWLLAKLDFGLSNSYSFVSPFYRVLNGRAHDIGTAVGTSDLTPGELFTFLVIAGSLALAWAFGRLAPGWRVAVAMLPVLAYCATATIYDFDKLQPVQAASEARLGLDTPLQRARGLNWVDDTLPDGAEAAFAPAVIAGTEVTRKAWWDLEYWNKSVVRMYDYEPAWRDSGFAAQKVTLDRRTGALDVDERLRYAVVPRLDRRFRPAGKVLAGTSLLHLLELSMPFRAEWAVLGTDGNGWSTAGEPATIHVYPSPDATASRRVDVAVELTSSPYHPASTRFRIDGGTRQVRGSVVAGKSVVARARLCQRPGQPLALVVRTPGDTVLPGGKHVGLAITAVRTKPAGRCATAPSA